MPIFKISGTKLKKRNSLLLDQEKNLCELVETKLTVVFDLLRLATDAWPPHRHSQRRHPFNFWSPQDDKA